MDTTGPSKVCSTASVRCRRWEETSSSIPEIEDDPQIEEGDDDDSEGETEELTTPFLCGLTDITLLRSFKTHISVDIWTGEVNI